MPLYIAKIHNHENLVQLLIHAVPMSTIRMPTADKLTLDETFRSSNPKKSFTSTRLTRKKDPELSDDSSDDGLLFDDGHSQGVTQIERPKIRKGRSSVKNSRSWILFRELS